jgi:lipopolysaccharide/colanic/teichoic acid biosynthesis glycosyltransferase
LLEREGAIGVETPLAREDVREDFLAAKAPAEQVEWPAHSRFVKRAFDIVVAVVVLLLSAPVIALAAFAIRLESPGAALFRHRRMGHRGRVFFLLKLRGMHLDAETRFPDLYDYDSQHHLSYFHCAEDPRVTRVGRILRRYSIDELPNFWNVLRGDMSVVGPRPDIPELAHLYGEHLETLLSVRPGVTSPAKAKGRDTLSFRETLDADLDYLARRSFFLDVITVIRTLTSVIRANGVH